MKRFFLPVTTLILAVCLIAGCVGEVRTYTDSGQTINIGVNQEFVIALGSNPTTGYSWHENYDEDMIKLVEKTYELGEEAKQGVVGTGGIEYFRFKTLQIGKTEIAVTYKRPWEKKEVEHKVFPVNIE